MKSKHILLLILAVITGLMASTCKKAADEVFNGSSRLRGVVLFQNYLTGTRDTAKTAVLTLTKSEINAPYVKTLTNGIFDIQSLNQGSYTLSVQFDFKQPGSGKMDHYKGTIPIELGKDQFKDQLSIVLALDSTGSATLQVQVVDGKGSIVTNAQVSLYNDASVLAANRGSSLGSLASVTSNADGKAIFSNLQLGSYFVAVNVVAGIQTLNNAATDQQPIAVTSAEKLDSTKVVIIPVGSSMQLTVNDVGGALLGNVNVYLYTDKSLLAKYRVTGSGSIRSGVTNSQGVVVFNGLQNVNFYASAYLLVGTDTLSNRSSDTLLALKATTGAPVNYNVTLTKNINPIPTALKITVRDVNFANINGANVSLYSDTSLLSKYRGTTTGSLMFGTTDVNGSVTFSSLQHIKYYISAYKVVGKDTISNKNSDTLSPFIPTTGQTNTKGVVIQK